MKLQFYKMIEAQTSSDLLTQEDHLTSDVGSAFECLPRRYFLGALFERIRSRNAGGSSLLDDEPTFRRLLDEIREMEFHFWPAYSAPRGLARKDDRDVVGTTPDLELVSPGFHIFWESKLASPLSGAEQIDQLPRQLVVLLDQVERRAQEDKRPEWFLVAVTPGSSPPLVPMPVASKDGESISAGATDCSIFRSVREYLRLVRERLRDPRAERLCDEVWNVAEEHILWIGWPDIREVLEKGYESWSRTAPKDDLFRDADPGVKAIVANTVELLEARGFYRFDGFGSLPPPPATAPWPRVPGRIFLDIDSIGQPSTGRRRG